MTSTKIGVGCILILAFIGHFWFDLGAQSNPAPQPVLQSTDPLRSLNAQQMIGLIDQAMQKNNLQDARKLYGYFDCLLVDEWVINHSNRLIERLKSEGKTIIATTDPAREPRDGELVIVYGNYHHAHNNLPYQDKIWRHPLYFKDIQHTRCEYHPAWESVGIIYIINLKERADRYQEMLAELCRMQAPLHRIHHFFAHKETVTGNKFLDPHIGCAKSHRDVTAHFLQSPHQHCAIFEDDVTFTCDTAGNLKRLKLFFDRNYDYEVCLLNSSKYHDIKEFDDLLLRSYQVCTTASAYLLSRKGAERANFYFRDGYEKLIREQNTNYAADRYWSAMQKDNKFFLFRTKFGYQRVGYSSITGNTECHFD